MMNVTTNYLIPIGIKIFIVISDATISNGIYLFWYITKAKGINSMSTIDLQYNKHWV